MKRAVVCVVCGRRFARSWDACPACGSWGSAIPAPEGSGARERGRVRLGDVPDLPTVRLACAEPWSAVLGGGLAVGSTTLVHGPRGVGKTTELVRLAASLGPRVLFVCREMGQGPSSLHSVARRSGVDAREIWVSDAYTLGDVCAEVSRPPAPRAIILDSLSALAPRAEVDALTALRRAAARDPALVCVVHMTKAGTMAGAEELGHLCDTIVRVDRDAITTEGDGGKNRYGALATAPRAPAVTSA